MAGALEGITVLEMALQYPGPYCSMLLSGLGAKVIKVERPDIGDPARRQPAFFNPINRGKRSLTLDLKQTASKDILYRLIKDCDVVTEGFRPGVASRLGIDYPTLGQINPHLIYCSITGFGQNGPYSDLPGHDLNYMALSGMLRYLQDAQGQPILPGVAIADLSAGMFAAIGILAALNQRHCTGKGCHVDVSMMDGLLSWMGTNLSIYANTGKTQKQRDSGYGLFTTADGKLLALGIAHEDWFWDRLCKALGLTDLSGIPVLERALRRQELIQPLQNVFLHKTRSEWLDLLKVADVPVTPVHDPCDVLDDPHVKSRGMAEILTDSQGSRSVRVGFPVKFSPVEQASPSADVPGLGEHTIDILETLGYLDDEIKRLRSSSVI